MARRYTLFVGTRDDYNDYNWLEAIETWAQRSRHKLEWMVDKSEDKYTARISIDGNLVSHVIGTGNNLRSARIKLIQELDRSEPAILTI
ncbi:unnamed protein product [Rhizoctonia solani]|uniref:Uncharacterized protein n=1 Tax=Rhizoctonia solani TaxID=456999 RepID=A0A8H2XUD9_9AGAM|nr:unnamed protein product [Rhizoctonia solani]